MAVPASSAVDPAEPEQSELAQATEWLEKITRDPLADAVRGRVRIVAVTAPDGRGRYQECVVDMIAEGPGIAATPVQQHVVFARTRRPTPGLVLPARISVSAPANLEVVWEALP